MIFLQQIQQAGTDFTQTRVTAGSNTGVDFAQANDGKGYIYNRDNADIIFGVNNAETFRLKADGRGLSQFTAKAWVSFNGSGTVAIKDGHNIASITDHGVGEYTASFTNSLANTNYATLLHLVIGKQLTKILIQQHLYMTHHQDKPQPNKSLERLDCDLMAIQYLKTLKQFVLHFLEIKK